MRERRADVEKVKREPEPLVAPVDGIIASANAMAGQIAEANAVIFQIVDPQRLWVEALAFDPETYAGKGVARKPPTPLRLGPPPKFRSSETKRRSQSNETLPSRFYFAAVRRARLFRPCAENRRAWRPPRPTQAPSMSKSSSRT
ncbi:HlyD family secretion protein [Rhodoblastus sp. 17X3]|uniref:HlyD family secretion protein n=1 Tax=Rhodoblastus sp. 17X3 TaxID=3047026 RepID=UPI00406CDE96